MSCAEPPNPSDDPAADDDAYYRHTLHALIDTAAALASTLTADASLSVAERIDALDRAARAVRRCIVLARHIAENPVRAAAARRTIARKQIIRAVGDSIERQASDVTCAESLHAELCERLDAPDLDDDILNRPIDDVIRDIRRDLGLLNVHGATCWPRRTPGDIAALAALAAAVPRPRPAAHPDLPARDLRPQKPAFSPSPYFSPSPAGGRGSG